MHTDKRRATGAPKLVIVSGSEIDAWRQRLLDLDAVDEGVAILIENSELCQDGLS